MKAQVGLIGLGVMGASLARNIASRGFSVCVYNRTESVTKSFIDEHGAENLFAASSLEQFVESLESPKRIIVMVKAGAAVDAVNEQLLPLLKEGDSIADAGNSFYRDTMRREKQLAEAGIKFLGVGVSGGEEGALKGPSIMPGSAPETYELWKDVLESCAAVAQGPCVAHIGKDGAGHFVKMVHNGIEYADMQLIAESYDLMKNLAGFDNEALASTFEAWNTGRLSSYLIEISSKIFRESDPEGTGELLDQILDKAGQKGTGRWTVQESLEIGCSVPAIDAAVQARNLSSRKEERVRLSELYPSDSPAKLDAAAFAPKVEAALFAGKLLSYAQGMRLIAVASEEFNWGVRLDEVSRVWMGGCIIRAKLLSELYAIFSESAPNSLLESEFYKRSLPSLLPSLRELSAEAIRAGIPVPCFSACLSYFDAMRSARLPHNLLQAQRDFFGAHTFERLDREGAHHHNWPSVA